MKGTRFAAIVAALALFCLGLIAKPAQAIEIQLPGERTMELHGFYEFRLSVLGEDLPNAGNGQSLSQFRHVLNLETEIELFPDGFSIFDFMMFYSRFIVLYECAYQGKKEGGCLVPGIVSSPGLFNSFDQYGGTFDEVNRQPRNLKYPVKDPAAFNGGVLLQKLRPGTQRTRRDSVMGTVHAGWPGPLQKKPQSRLRFRGPINDHGVLNNPNGLAAFANLNARSKLDQPIREFADVRTKIRAASYSPVFHINYLQFARASLGEESSQALVGSFLADNFLRSVVPQGSLQGDPTLCQRAPNDPRCSGVGALWAMNTAIARLNSGSIQLGGTPDQQAFQKAQLTNTRNALLFNTPFGLPSFIEELDDVKLDYFTFDPSYYASYDLDVVPDTIQIPDANNPGEFLTVPTDSLNLIETRPDPNRYEILANATSPELLTAYFGTNAFPQDSSSAYLATIDTPIRPQGYFRSPGSEENPSLDIISPYGAGVMKDLGGVDTLSFPRGAVREPDVKNNVIPFFLGPDGLTNSADDLPFGRIVELDDGRWEGQGGLVLSQPGDVYGTWAGLDAGTGRPTFNRLGQIPDPRQALNSCGPNMDEPCLLPDARIGGRPLVLYGEYDDAVISVRGCNALGGTGSVITDDEGDTFVDCDLGGQKFDDQAELLQRGCKSITNAFDDGGINADGHCVLLNVRAGTPTDSPGVHVRLVEALGRASLRPDEAQREPLDLTDVVAFSQFDVVQGSGRVGKTPPARPRAPGNQIFFESLGYRKFNDDEHATISSLDLDFDVDELRWGHGASQDEHEFFEGYLEFEMFDSQLWARLGKLIMVWGKTELFRNQDRLNPVDISNGVITRLEEARIGQWALQTVISPERFMRVGPIEDLRMELVWIFDDFEPQDLGKCGESSVIALICGKGFGAYAHGLAGIGIAGEVRPDKKYSGIKKWDYGIRFEGRWDRFTFSVSDFWGWDDGFLIEPINRYVRRVDPNTGAPVNGTGALGCEYRSADGSGTTDPNESVGPDGDAETINDNLIPSIGNCLLFDDPVDGEAQDVRASNEIAASHYANLTLFHTICTMTFDPDQGFCAFDRLTNPIEFGLIGFALSGGTGSNIAVAGAKTIKLKGDPYAPNATQVEPGRRILGQLIPGVDAKGTDTLPFSAEQGALLGCGPSFGSACGTHDKNHVFQTEEGEFFVGDGSVEKALILDSVNTDLPGGVDFLNADGSVMLQDFTVLKASAQPFTIINPSNKGALVATRNRDFDALGNFENLTPLRWEAGVTIAGLNLRQRTGEQDLPDGSTLGPVLQSLATASQMAPLSLSERADVVDALVAASGEFGSRATDGWIEPFPWKLDEEALANGEVLYKAADQTQKDARCDPENRFVRNPDGSFSSEIEPRVDLDDDGNPFPAGFDDDEVSFCSFRNPFWEADNAQQFQIPNDPSDPTNPLNEFIDDYERVADVCHPFQSSPAPLGQNQAFLDGFNGGSEAFAADRGCTMLERFSANLERFLMLLEIVGPDRHFDPPETVQEIFSMSDGDWLTDIQGELGVGDPISGPDSIFTRNKFVFGQETETELLDDDGNPVLDDDGNALTILGTSEPSVADLQVSEQPSFGAEVAPGDVFPEFDPSEQTVEEFLATKTEREFFQAFDSDANCTTQTSWLRVGSRIPPSQPIISTKNPIRSALPICQQGTIAAHEDIDGDGSDDFGKSVAFSPLWLANADNPQCSRTPDPEDSESVECTGRGLGQLALGQLLAGGIQTVNLLATGANGEDIIAPISMTAAARRRLLSNNDADLDGDNEGIRELDQDQDGVWDGVDDYTPGPVSDDNIYCGSGIPGDILQNAPQFDFISADEEALAQEIWGENLEDFPNRSPSYCASVTGLLGATNQTLPFVKAAGDGTWGRRDFFWQNGQQLKFDYQKRNVFGFGLDFAEDRTKTSWGIEFSWLANTLIGNTRSFSGYSDADVFTMSVSVDRPTFINFLNPNRSFFMNFQFFMQYVLDYEGGPSARDGNYGGFENAFSIPTVVFTFFSGYFQDRLAPRTSIIWSPPTQTYGVLWGLSYRWSGNFTTSLAMNNFWGTGSSNGTSIQKNYFPVVQNADTTLSGLSFRGFTPVVNREVVFLTMRYSW